MTQHFFPSVHIFYSVEHLRLTKQTLIVFLQNMSHLNNIQSLQQELATNPYMDISLR